MSREATSASQVPADYWDTLPLGRDVALIKHDANGLAALAKPAGTLSHPNESRDQPRSLLNARYITEGEFFEWEHIAPNADAPDTPVGKRRLWLLNRLDSATSGVILAASSEKLAHEIRAMFQKRHIRKIYAALVFGNAPTGTHAWRDRLAVQKRGGQIRTAAAGNIPAESHMTLLKAMRSGGGAGAQLPMSLIQLEPKTGRSHQLRVQCARRHLPIVGDATYGDFRANRDFAKRTGEKRLFLHSLETGFDYTFAGRNFSFSAKAELPREFLG